MNDSIGVLILAGGKNSRMGGRHKAMLELDGGTFLSHMNQVFSAFPEKILSTGCSDLSRNMDFLVVSDEVQNQGPLAGLAAALYACKSCALIVVACDMPFINDAFVRYLLQFANGHKKAAAMAVKDRSGRLHPLCGIYRKTAYDTIQTALKQGEYRVMNVFWQLGGIEIPLAGTPFQDKIVANINTYEEWEALVKHS